MYNVGSVDDRVFGDTRAAKQVAATIMPSLAAEGIKDAASTYEKGSQMDRTRMTLASLRNSGVSSVNEGMADLARERSKKATPLVEERVLQENVMLYTPGSASAESGIQFMPHSNQDANMAEQAVIDKTNIDSMLKPQYARIVMPQNGRINYSGAIVNNIIVETAERSVMTRFRGRENAEVHEELRYHPLGFLSDKTNDKSIWAFKKEDLSWGINPDAIVTSNIEYLPQHEQTKALEASKSADGAAQALADLYARSVDLTEFDRLKEPKHSDLDSHNPVPAPADDDGEYADDVDPAYLRQLLESNRSSNGVSRAYAPQREAWFSKPLIPEINMKT